MNGNLLNDFIWVLTAEEQATLLLLAYGFTEDELRARKPGFDRTAQSIEKKFEAFQTKKNLKPEKIIQKLH